MRNAELLDKTIPAGAITGAKPWQSVDLLQDNFNAIVGAIQVAGSIPLLTAKLDADTGVTATDYAATCNPATLGDVLTKFNALLAKLDADSGVTATNHGTTALLADFAGFLVTPIDSQ